MQACLRGQDFRVKSLLSVCGAGFKDAAINAVHGKDGSTALMAASLKGHSDVVMSLLSHGAGVNTTRVKDGTTALMVASLKGHSGVVALLLAASATVNSVRTDNGGTALMMASQDGHTDVVALLLAAGANADNVRTDNGYTALMVASSKGNRGVVKLLLGGKTNRCWTCNKKIGLTGFECKCGLFYCGVHRSENAHDCKFNFAAVVNLQLVASLPLIAADKVIKL
jgi:hypothetical protein